MGGSGEATCNSSWITHAFNFARAKKGLTRESYPTIFQFCASETNFDKEIARYNGLKGTRVAFPSFNFARAKEGLTRESSRGIFRFRACEIKGRAHRSSSKYRRPIMRVRDGSLARKMVSSHLSGRESGGRLSGRNEKAKRGTEAEEKRRRMRGKGMMHAPRARAFCGPPH